MLKRRMKMAPANYLFNWQRRSPWRRSPEMAPGDGFVRSATPPSPCKIYCAAPPDLPTITTTLKRRYAVDSVSFQRRKMGGKRVAWKRGCLCWVLHQRGDRSPPKPRDAEGRPAPRPARRRGFLATRWPFCSCHAMFFSARSDLRCISASSALRFSHHGIVWGRRGRISKTREPTPC